MSDRLDYHAGATPQACKGRFLLFVPIGFADADGFSSNLGLIIECRQVCRRHTAEMRRLEIMSVA